MVDSGKRWLLWLPLGLILLAGLLFLFQPRAVPVDLYQVDYGPMALTLGDEGQTRVKDVFTLTAPVTGRLRRIEVDPGDLVVAQQDILAEIEPANADLLDPRSEAEAEARVQAAEAGLGLAAAELEKANADLTFAKAELLRHQQLAAKNTLSLRELEASEQAYASSLAAVAVASSRRQMLEFELNQAKARLLSPDQLDARRSHCDCIKVKAPVDGQVLQVFRESEGWIASGQNLMTLGDPEQLEVVVDLLSVDAVKVQVDDQAWIKNWGGDQVLAARVQRIEPYGFTKTSALGIEEQRVNVVLSIESPREQWSQLGHGYQVDVEILLWQEDNVLQVPLTALFRTDDGWALFVVENDTAKRRQVTLGHRSNQNAQIQSGLQQGERVVVYPGEFVDDGVRVMER